MIPHTMSIEITQLVTYPVKSCAGITHQSIGVNALGLDFDRQWMVIDASGRFISQREHPQMALIQPRIEDNQLWLSHPSADACQVTTGDTIAAVSVWKDSLKANLAAEPVNAWLSKILGTPCRLVCHSAVSNRLIEPDHNRGDDAVAFADGFPILVTHEASLQALNQTLPAPIPMSRFRSNVVVRSSEPAFAELAWQALNHETGRIELRKPCTRCVMTGVDQTTGEQTGSIVLKTLKQQFPHDNKAVFGMNGVSEPALTTLSVGMTFKAGS